MLHRLRCGVTALVATAATAALLVWLLPRAAAPGTGLPGRLGAACAVLGAVAATWLCVLVWLVAVEAAARVDGRATPRPAPVPARVRRLVLAACGTVAATGDASPAPAGTPGGHHPGVSVAAVVARALHDDGSPEHAGVPASPRPHHGEVVTVRTGDCLWGLAARDLATDAGGGTMPPADVARRWREIYAANRAVVGTDPALLRPGQRLRLPR
jgi:nucleoid-associated protein YgaU